MLPDDEIERALAESDEDAVRALFAAAMQAGGVDNISVIVVSVREGELRMANNE